MRPRGHVPGLDGRERPRARRPAPHVPHLRRLCLRRHLLYLAPPAVVPAPRQPRRRASAPRLPRRARPVRGVPERGRQGGLRHRPHAGVPMPDDHLPFLPLGRHRRQHLGRDRAERSSPHQEALRAADFRRRSHHRRPNSSGRHRAGPRHVHRVLGLQAAGDRPVRVVRIAELDPGVADDGAGAGAGGQRASVHLGGASTGGVRWGAGVPRRVAPRRLGGARRGGGAGRGGARVGAADAHPGARVHRRVPEPLRLELGAGELVARRACGGMAAHRRPTVRLPRAGGARRRRGGGLREVGRRSGQQGVGVRQRRRGDGARGRREGQGHAEKGCGDEEAGARGCRSHRRRRHGQGLIRARHGTPP